MNLYSLLPLLNGWSYEAKKRLYTLPIGGYQKICEYSKPGFLLFWTVRLYGSKDSKYTAVKLEIEKTKPLIVDFMPYGVYSFGISQANNYTAWVGLWDDTNKVYTLVVTPSQPMVFREGVKLTLEAPTQPLEDPTTSSYKVHSGYGLILIDNMEAFKRSLREVLAKHP